MESGEPLDTFRDEFPGDRSGWAVRLSCDGVRCKREGWAALSKDGGASDSGLVDILADAG